MMLTIEEFCQIILTIIAVVALFQGKK